MSKVFGVDGPAAGALAALDLIEKQNPPPERMNGSSAVSSKPSPETAPARGTETPRTKELFDGIKARRNARGFHMPQDIDDAEESHAKLEHELSSAQEQIAALREALEPFAKVASSMDGYNDGLATFVAATCVGGRRVFALDSLWVKHWRAALAATRKEEA